MILWCRRATVSAYTSPSKLCVVKWLVAMESTHKHEAIKQKFARLEKRRERGRERCNKRKEKELKRATKK